MLLKLYPVTLINSLEGIFVDSLLFFSALPIIMVSTKKVLFLPFQIIFLFHFLSLFSWLGSLGLCQIRGVKMSILALFPTLGIKDSVFIMKYDVRCRFLEIFFMNYYLFYDIDILSMNNVEFSTCVNK